MSDDLNNRGAQDLSRISLNAPRALGVGAQAARKALTK
ncbi:DUF3606 domain-containing protein [Duganella aceris]|jgi:hypothetical protein|uniref:DUF3606 domain-containing protein n=1 Tax=Duganella aceris TaxID=2703883 RepID=A0ABX0FNN0_9BURK|nr:DUF3606 domain-containing protein [Duganella aceris]NGZ86223.1 DUF3606 domain-containing protein [Duganella aceris]